MEMSSEAETAHSEPPPPPQAKSPPVIDLAADESSEAILSYPGTSSSHIRPSIFSFLNDRSINGPASKRQCLDSKDLNALSTSIYLDITVVPILSTALLSLDRLRPEDPVQFVIDFLQNHKEKFSKNLPKSNGQQPVKEA